MTHQRKKTTCGFAAFTVRRLSALCLFALLTMLIPMLARVAFISIYVPTETLTGHTDAMPLLVFNALRFDMQTVAYVLLVPTVILLAGMFVRTEAFARISGKINVWYFTVVATILAALCVIDLGFYRNFNSHINLTFFDFFNEGPLGLLQAIWEEYNVIGCLLALIAVGTGVYWTGKKIEKIISSFKIHSSLLTPHSSLFILLLYIAGIVVCMRGSVWRYPLQAEDIFVSESKVFNDIVPNATYMLKKAYKEKKNAFVIKDIEQIIKDYGYSSLADALNTPIDSSSDTLQLLREALFTDTPDTLSAPQPNVLIILGESWGTYLMNLDNEQTNLLYGMRRHFAEDLLFRNFQSVQNGTVATIENVTVATPFHRMFRSRYRLTTLPTSIALPFNDSGYHTEFISGMDMAWENCAEALTHQGFAAVSDKYHLLKEDASYRHNSIGVYDEHLFSSIYNRLQTESDTPKMILAVTTTNHPPFEFPDDMQLETLPESIYSNPTFAVNDKEVLDKYLDGYRYLNKELGEFLDKFKASPAADNTIIMVTGDHNVRSIIDYNTVDRRWQYSVPLYVYLPPYLRKESHSAMTSRLGSHDDILPTVAPFALKGTSYMRLGNNLLADSIPDSRFYSRNVEQLLANDSVRNEIERKTHRLNMLREAYLSLIMCNL